MNIEEKQIEIDKLQQQIWALEDEIFKEKTATILPFLREHAVFVVLGNYYTSLGFSFPNKEKEKEYFERFKIESYHWHDDIDDFASISYDDGKHTLRFAISGHVSTYMTQFINACKKYQIKVDFSVVERNAERELQSAHKNIEEINYIKGVLKDAGL